MSQLQTPESQESNRTNRRAFLRRGAAATTAVATLGYGSLRLDHGPVGNAQAALPLAPVGYTLGGAAIGYITRVAYDVVTGDTRDLSGYQGADSLAAETHESTKSIQSADERVLTGIINNLEASQNIGLSKGKAAAIRSMNNGADQSVAQTAMTEAVEEYYTGIQQNLLNHRDTQISQIIHLIENIDVHEDMDHTNYFSIYDTSNDNLRHDGIGTYSLSEEDVELVDGTVTDHVTWSGAYTGSYRIDESANNAFYYQPAGTGDFGTSDYDNELRFWYNDPYYESWTDAQTYSTAVIDNLAGFIADVYDAYEPGEIPTEDIVDPITTATELSQDYDGYQAQGAFASMLGIPTSADQSLFLNIHFEDGDSEVWADIFTNHVPGEGTDNEGFQTGNTYAPSTWNDPLYIAYEYTDEESGETSTDFIQLEDDFTIQQATDADGQDIESFQTRSTNIQTSDVTTLEEELAQIRDEQIRLQEESQGGGAGLDLSGLDVGGIPGEVIALAAAAGAAILAFGD